MGFDYTSLATNRFEMPKGWCVVLVQDMATVNEESIKPNYRHRRIEYIDIASVEKGTVKSIQELLLDDAPSRAKRIVRDNDTLIATVRPNLEHYVYIKKAKQNTIASTGFAVVTAKKVNPRFLYYYLTTKPFTSYLTQIADSHTSAYPAFNPDIIETAQLLLPHPSEQLAIATILGTLDDKIELNRQMSQTLEAMAQALFKSWFVDFEPFRDEGMEDSPLGPIPRGWRVGTLSNITGFLSGFAFKSRDWIDEGVPVVKIGSVKPGVIDLKQVSYVAKGIADQASTYRLKVGDLLVGMTGYVGEVGLVPPTDNLPLLNQRVGKFVLPQEGTFCLAFVYCTTRRSEFKTYVESQAHGTAQPNVSSSAILNYPMVLPPKQIHRLFDDKYRYVFDRILGNLSEIDTLATIRDTLLPKLLSGKIQVKDAEKFVEVKI